MSQVRVVTDSIADIPPSIAVELGITVIPAIVRFGDEMFEAGVNLSNDEFYARLRSSPVLPQTAVPPVGVFEAIYRQLGRETDQIVSIHIPARLSGMMNAALIAARALPELQIEVIDSTNISMALGWLVIMAARAANEGRSLDEIVIQVRQTIPKIRLLAVMDTLEYAEKGGRIGKGRALVGTLLRVKPLLQVLNSELLPIENVRTIRRAIARLVELVGELGPLAEASVVHADASGLAHQVREMLAPIHPVDRIPIAEAGPVLGAHAGPGAVGVACVLK
jgi:DegV family protein with EDD domain